jgi:hypothetical protein
MILDRILDLFDRALTMAGCSACSSSLLLMMAAAPAMIIAFSSSWGSPEVKPMTTAKGLFILINVVRRYAIQHGKMMASSSHKPNL